MALEMVCWFDYVHSGKFLTQQLVFSFIHLARFYADPSSNRNVFLSSFIAPKWRENCLGFITFIVIDTCYMLVFLLRFYFLKKDDYFS